ncbi:MAG: hypothetical protein QW695_05545, partial [Candidatus Bathyarchaeia archaeon]
MSYADISKVRDRIGGLDYNSFGFDNEEGFEAYIGRLIDTASRLVDRYCSVPNGFFKGGVDMTVVYRGRDIRVEDGGGSYIIPPYTPIIQVISVEKNIGDDRGPVWSPIGFTRVDDRIYLLDQPNLNLKQSIRLSMRSGFIEVDPVIESIVIESVASFLLEF